MVEGRSKKVFKRWLEERDEAFRKGLQVMVVDGFTAVKAVAVETLPDAIEVMVPFHVVR